MKPPRRTIADMMADARATASTASSPVAEALAAPDCGPAAAVRGVVQDNPSSIHLALIDAIDSEPAYAAQVMDENRLWLAGLLADRILALNLGQHRLDIAAALRLAIPSGVCLTNRNVPDSQVVSLDATMGDLRKIAAAYDTLTRQQPDEDGEKVERTMRDRFIDGDVPPVAPKPERGELVEAIAHLRQRADQAENMASKEEDWHAVMPGDVRAEMKREAASIRTILAALATQEQATLPGISFDGPNRPSEHRVWLARKLLDGKLDDAEAYSIVRASPAVRGEATVAEQAIRHLSRLVRVYGDMEDGNGNTPTEIRHAERFLAALQDTPQASGGE